MNSNYKTIKDQIHKYSVEFLKADPEPLEMLEQMNGTALDMIENAQKPNLLAASIVYVYLKRHNLNGRGGITAKDVAKYFGVGAPAISQKSFDVAFRLYNEIGSVSKNKVYEFIDRDRFKVNQLYWDFLESKDADDVKKSIKILQSIIQKDKNYFDPYITLSEYYLMNNNMQKAIKTLEDGYIQAINLITNNGRFPDELPWGFMENRHIIRMIFNYAMLLWENAETEQALNIFMQLLKSNPNDNIGARYSIVAILEGFSSQEEYEEQFESESGYGLEYGALEEWFNKSAKKHKNVIGWWIDTVEE